VLGIWHSLNKKVYIVNTYKQYLEIHRVLGGPVGEVALMERFPALPEMRCPRLDGVALVKVADGTLSQERSKRELSGVIPGVFIVRNALVCVVLILACGQYFSAYVNLRNEREAAALRAMARQGFAMLGLCDGTTGLLGLLQHRPPENLYAMVFEVLEEAQPWTEAQYRDALQAFELSFGGDPEGLVLAMESDANIVVRKALMSLPTPPIKH